METFKRALQRSLIRAHYARQAQTLPFEIVDLTVRHINLTAEEVEAIVNELEKDGFLELITFKGYAVHPEKRIDKERVW